jgi:tagatose-6-phosphate ketose/aldose isomerase
MSASPALGLSAELLAARGGEATAREIAQQPLAWRATRALLTSQRGQLDAFLAPLLATPDLRIIFTGAGTSSFIGQCLAPVLLPVLGRRIEAIATTELVAGPRDYLQREAPTLLVSFSRSGASPESLAAIDLADRCLDRCHHLVISCNPEGELYRSVAGGARRYALLLPELAHDHGFAMTASFSSMYYAALAIFSGIEAAGARIEALGRAADALIEQHGARLQALAQQDFPRVVFLGSRGHAGLAAEAALKLLELTDGAVVAMADTPLGFRHGPKAIVNGATLVVMFVSNDPRARRYELDLLRELAADAAAGALLAITALPPQEPQQCDWLRVPGLDSARDADLTLPFVVCAQLYAFHRSLALGNAPDTPCRSGRVNRIVKGVTIYPL